MKKTEQQEVNEWIAKSFDELIGTIKIGRESRSAIIKLLKFESSRIDSLENKVDIIMRERAAEPKIAIDPSKVIKSKPVMEKECDVWYNEESKKKHLEKELTEHLGKQVYKQMNDTIEANYLAGFNLGDIAETTITPRALIELGFNEVYQDVDYGEPGYIFYSHEIKGVGFYSVDTDDKDFHVRMDNSDYEIRNLRKLRDLILSLNEVN
jgi:hypothetical protein